MDSFYAVPQVGSTTADAECQTDLELLWEFLAVLQKQGQVPDHLLDKPKRKKGKIVKYEGESEEEISVDLDASKFLDAEQDTSTNGSTSTVNVDEAFVDLYGGEDSKDEDADYVPAAIPRKRGRPPGSGRKPNPMQNGALKGGGKIREAAENMAKKQLFAYLEQQGKSTEIFGYTKHELADILAGFYCDWLTGSNWNKRSIQTYACALRRIFLREGHGPTTELDIKLDPEFEVANNALKSAIEVSQFLKKDTLSHIVLSVEDMIHIYRSGVLRTTCAEGLLNKVIFEIILLVKDVQVLELYSLTMNDLVQGVDELGRECYQFKGSRYRLVKSDSPFCPYASMHKFVEKHPQPLGPKKWSNQMRLLLRPDSEVGEEARCWYGTSPVGKNPMKTFMQRISECVGLSMIYTNVGLRTTPIETWEAAMEAISPSEEGGIITIMPDPLQDHEVDTHEKISEAEIEVESQVNVEAPGEISVIVGASGEISVTLGATCDIVTTSEENA